MLDYQRDQLDSFFTRSETYCVCGFRVWSAKRMKMIRRLWLFVRIVWRESPAGGNMDLKTAWTVARIIH